MATSSPTCPPSSRGIIHTGDGRTLLTNMKVATRNLQRATLSLVSMLDPIMKSFIENGLRTQSKPYSLAISVCFSPSSLQISQILRIDGWDRSANPMKKMEFGIWEITVPALPSGRCAIPHDTKVKVGKNSRHSLTN